MQRYLTGVLLSAKEGVASSRPNNPGGAANESRPLVG
jgi:hypothetical protein